MRAALLFLFFVCIFLHFKSKAPKTVEHDVINTSQAAFKKFPTTSTRLPATQEKSDIVTLPTTSADIDTSSLIADADVEAEEEYDEEDLTQLPFEDIEDGWKNNLKEYLTGVNPEKADEMYTSYMEEKKKYMERVDFSERETTVADDLAKTDEAIQDTENKVLELERNHIENLKEIFGDHYTQVENLHKEYVESVQYMNRSPVKFSISL